MLSLVFEKLVPFPNVFQIVCNPVDGRLPKLPELVNVHIRHAGSLCLFLFYFHFTQFTTETSKSFLSKFLSKSFFHSFHVNPQKRAFLQVNPPGTAPPSRLNNTCHFNALTQPNSTVNWAKAATVEAYLCKELLTTTTCLAMRRRFSWIPEKKHIINPSHSANHHLFITSQRIRSARADAAIKKATSTTQVSRRWPEGTRRISAGRDR